jgi:glycosyltransferase involved in cell wall biosynthesis
MDKVMQKALTVSIIIPAYNEEDHLPACLDAIARQSIAPDEVIVVDNNSSDATAQIARSYSFVRVIRESRQGLYFSRQTGMAAATGDVLCRIDADTIIGPDWIAGVRRCFADPSVLAATGPVGYHDTPASRLTLWVEHMLLKGALALRYRFMFGCNMAIRRSTWFQVADELCNESFLMEDVDIILHLKRRGIYPIYSTALHALVSARRLLDPLPQFARYIHGHTRTHTHHNESIVGAVYSEVIFVIVHILCRPVLLFYDPVLRRFSFGRLMRRPESRPDPMSGEQVAEAPRTRPSIDYES